MIIISHISTDVFIKEKQWSHTACGSQSICSQKTNIKCVYCVCNKNALCIIYGWTRSLCYFQCFITHISNVWATHMCVTTTHVCLSIEKGTTTIRNNTIIVQKHIHSGEKMKVNVCLCVRRATHVLLLEESHIFTCEMNYQLEESENRVGKLFVSTCVCV